MKFITGIDNPGERVSVLGHRAHYLAQLKSHGFSTPPCFVLNTEAMKLFFAHNAIEMKISSVMKKSEELDSATVRQLTEEVFLKSEFPNELQSELEEAYNTLSFGDEVLSVSNLLEKKPAPFVFIYPSLSYEQAEDDESGFFVDVKGMLQLLNSIKLCYASLFYDKALDYRNKNSVPQSFLSAVVVGRMPGYDATATTFSLFDKKGQDDYILVIERLGEYNPRLLPQGSKYLVSRDILSVKSRKEEEQAFVLKRSSKEEKLVHSGFDKEEASFFFNDSTVIELARLSRNADEKLGCYVKMHIGLKGSKLIVFFTDCIGKRRDASVQDVQGMPVEETSIEEDVLFVDDLKGKTKQDSEAPQEQDNEQPTSGIVIDPVLKSMEEIKKAFFIMGAMYLKRMIKARCNSSSADTEGLCSEIMSIDDEEVMDREEMVWLIEKLDRVLARNEGLKDSEFSRFFMLYSRFKET